MFGCFWFWIRTVDVRMSVQVFHDVRHSSGSEPLPTNPLCHLSTLSLSPSPDSACQWAGPAACQSDLFLLRDWCLSSWLGGAYGTTWSLLGVSVTVSLIRPPLETLRTVRSSLARHQHLRGDERSELL